MKPLLLALMLAACYATHPSAKGRDILPRGDGFTSPEERADLVFVGADFLSPCSNGVRPEVKREVIKKNAIATRIQVWRNEVLAVFPKFKPGVPVSAGRTSMVKNPNPKWKPMPCWELHTEGICDSIQSAVDIVIDSNNHAWILDSGYVDGLNETKQTCPPKVVVVDLDTNQVSRQIDLSSLTCATSRVQFLQVHYTLSGRHFVYVSDATNQAILVWDVLEAKGSRFVLPEQVLAGCEKDKRDVLYLALVRHPDGSSLVVFTYLSSCVMFTIRAEFLRRGSVNGKVMARGVKQDKMVLLGSDGGSGVFFRYEGRPEVYKWDTTKKFKVANFEKVYMGQKYRLATSVAADYERCRMVILESNFPDFVEGCVGCGVSHTISEMRLLPNAVRFPHQHLQHQQQLHKQLHQLHHQNHQLHASHHQLLHPHHQHHNHTGIFH